MRTALKWGNYVITTLLVIAVIVTMYCTVSSRINGGTPKIFGREMYVVLSGSMEPGIHTGSVIFDKTQVDMKSLKVGDVITFKLPKGNKLLDNDAGAIVTHRIAAIKQQDGNPAFTTKGDANDDKDPWTVTPPDVIAQYDNTTIPYLGYYLNFLKSKLGIWLLVITPGILMILSTVYTLLREIAKLQKRAKQAEVAAAAEPAAPAPAEAANTAHSNF